MFIVNFLFAAMGGPDCNNTIISNILNFINATYFFNVWIWNYLKISSSTGKYQRFLWITVKFRGYLAALPSFT